MRKEGFRPRKLVSSPVVGPCFPAPIHFPMACVTVLLLHECWGSSLPGQDPRQVTAQRRFADCCSRGHEALLVRSDSSHSSPPSPSQQSFKEVSLVLRARARGAWPASLTAGPILELCIQAFPLHKQTVSSGLPLVSFLQQAHLFNHNVQVWKVTAAALFSEGWRSPDVTVFSVLHRWPLNALHSFLPHTKASLRRFYSSSRSQSFLWGPCPTPQGQAASPYPDTLPPHCRALPLFSIYFCDNLVNVCLPH